MIAVSIAFETNENMRYKFFVEPSLVVLLVAQAAGRGAGDEASRPAPSC